MDVVGPGAANGRPAAPSSPSLASPSLPNGAVIDGAVIVDHLSQLLEITLGATPEDLQAPGSLLSAAKREETIQRCQRFGSENQIALYVQKDLASSSSSSAVVGDPVAEQSNGFAGMCEPILGDLNF